jgi:hypothetical protein
MIYHVLPGDSLVETFKKSGIEGEIVVCREAFVSGDLDGETLDEFWDTRANLIAVEHGGDPIEYRDNVAGELEKLFDAQAGDEVNLWFEYELFCSVNMWFCLDLLKNSEASLFRVAPVNLAPDKIWDGFGQTTERELVECFESRIQFLQQDISVAVDLWNAFRVRDDDKIRSFSEYRSACLPFLREVCEAAVELSSRPAELVKELKAEGLNSIEEVFPEFRKRAAVYGFGDSQVESLLRHL